MGARSRHGQRDALGEALIDAAARAILIRGFPSMTMHHVAELAGVHVDELRMQCRRKESLFTAIVDRAAALLTTPLDEAVTLPGSDRERLDVLFQRKLGAVDANRNVFLVAIKRHLRPDEFPIVPALSGGVSRLQLYLSKLEEWFAAHVSSPTDTDPTLRAHLVGGAVVGFLAHWAASGGRHRAVDHFRAFSAIAAPTS
jgi:AcrR family transcriptional regulator